MKAFHIKQLCCLTLVLGLLGYGCGAYGATTSSSRSSSGSRTTSSQNRSVTTSGRTGTGTSGGGSYGSTSRQYPNATMVGDAIITSDSETRRLIVITDDDTNEQIKAVIASLDQPKPQVLINVVFLQVTHGNDLDFGVDAHYKKAAIDDESKGIVQTLFGASSLTNGAFYRLAHTNVDATISALSAVGKTEILSRPSILARSSQQATITVGQEVPFITNSRVTDTGQTVNTVQYQDIGIILRVTPYITQEGMVEMIVAPEISSLSDRTVAVSDTVKTSVIDKRSADTVVVTPDGKTVVIGGMISTTMTNSDKQVPILGDIPILGMAFKYRNRSETKQELLIFMTPHVVKRPTDLIQLSTQEEQKLEMTPKTFEKKELQKFLGKEPGKP